MAPADGKYHDPRRRAPHDQTAHGRRRYPYSTCRDSGRATGIIAYLEMGGVIEKTQQVAARESPWTTRLYDRTQDDLTLDEIERIAI